MRSEFVGDILAVRAVEDSIRATNKYTKGAFSRPVQHPEIDGEYPSRVLTERYEVYPDLDLAEVRPIWETILTASDWLWGDTPHIDVRFNYNYHRNKAMVAIRGGEGAIRLLRDGIPGFGDALDRVKENGNGNGNRDGVDAGADDKGERESKAVIQEIKIGKKKRPQKAVQQAKQ